MKRVDWLVLKEVAASGQGLQAFTLHRRLFLDVQSLSQSLKRLQEAGLVNVLDGHAQASENGVRMVLVGVARQNENSLKKFRGRRGWQRMGA